MKYTVTLCVLLMVFGNMLHSQSRNSTYSPGEIRGKVIDSKTKKPLDYASITLFNKNKKVKATALSEDDGSYIIKTLEQGEYTLRVSYAGYENFEVNDIDVIDDQITFVNCAMQIDKKPGRMITIACNFRCGLKSLEAIAIPIPPRSLIEEKEMVSTEAVSIQNEPCTFACSMAHRSREIERKNKKDGAKLFNEISVSPNPTTDYIQLESLYDGNKSLCIYNGNGTQVFHTNVIHHVSISTAGFNNGVYFVVVTDEKYDDKTTTRFVVVH